MKKVEARILQYQRSTEPDSMLSFIQEIVRGKLTNYRNLLLKYNRQKNAQVIKSNFTLRSLVEKVQEVTAPESLLGIEGSGSASYFSGFRELLRQDLGFEKRQKRPPKDPVNSMLSFGYTLLFREFCVLINIVGLDPFIGFFHAAEDRRESLALDFMEEFRPFVDRIVLSIINLQEVNASNFTLHSDGSVTMDKRTIALFMKKFYDDLHAEYFYNRTNEHLKLRNIMENQVRLLEKHLANEALYIFYEM